MTLRLLLVFLITASARAAERPNILFLLSDDQDWSGLSVAMHPDIPGSKNPVFLTPNLEKFAAQSMRFSTAYAPSPVCAPTRISLQTGLNTARLQWTKAAPALTAADGYQLIPPVHRRAIRDDETTIAQVLKTAGYATAHYGKWHLAGGGPEAHGYDESDGDTGNEQSGRFKGDNPVDIYGMGTRATAFMEKSKEAGEPFFIQMSYNALHSPENASPESLEKFTALMPNSRERAVQIAALTYDLDAGVGKLLASLDSLGLSENTYVIYMSDNGGRGAGSRGNRALRGGKGDLWEGGIRVPLIIRGPGITPDSWSHQRTVGFDLFPTFCEIAGITSPPENLEGGSILPQLHGNTDPIKRPHEELVFHFPHYQGDTPHSAIYLGDYKLLHFYETGENKLFNITSDIAEKTDLATELPEKTTELAEKLSTYLTEAKAQLPTENPQAVPGKTYVMTKGAQGKRGGRKRCRQIALGQISKLPKVYISTFFLENRRFKVEISSSRWFSTPSAARTSSPWPSAFPSSPRSSSLRSDLRKTNASATSLLAFLEPRRLPLRSTLGVAGLPQRHILDNLLPLHLCDLAAIIAGFALFTRKRRPPHAHLLSGASPPPPRHSSRPLSRTARPQRTLLPFLSSSTSPSSPLASVYWASPRSEMETPTAPCGSHRSKVFGISIIYQGCRPPHKHHPRHQLRLRLSTSAESLPHRSSRHVAALSLRHAGTHRSGSLLPAHPSFQEMQRPMPPSGSCSPLN